MNAKKEWLEGLERRLEYQLSVGTGWLGSFYTLDVLRAVKLARLAIEAYPMMDNESEEEWCARFDAIGLDDDSKETQ